MFDRDAIRKHINNVFSEAEVDKDNNTQKMRVVGVRQKVPLFKAVSHFQRVVEKSEIYGDDEMIRKYADSDIDAVMEIWLITNIQAHSFISPDYWKSNFDVVKEMLPLAEIYVHEIDSANRIDGFIGLNNDYIEGIFIKDVAQSKGIGKQLLDQVKKIRATLKLNVYQKNERAIQFYLREEFSILSECVDDNTGEKEFTMVWKR